MKLFSKAASLLIVTLLISSCASKRQDPFQKIAEKSKPVDEHRIVGSSHIKEDKAHKKGTYFLREKSIKANGLHFLVAGA